MPPRLRAVKGPEIGVGGLLRAAEPGRSADLEGQAGPSSAPPQESGPPDRQVRSPVKRALQAIERLADGPLGASALARTLGVNRSSALRLLRELEEFGYVTRGGEGLFRLSSVRFARLAASQTGRSEQSEIVRPLLSALRDEFGEATMLGVPAGDEMVYLAFFPSLHHVAVRERLGTVRPMHTSAIGKAYLASLDAASLDIQLGRISFVGGTAAAAGGPLELKRRVEEARRLGYAVDRDETFEGVRCVATSLHIEETLVGAIGVSGPSQRLSEARMEEIGLRLKELAGRPYGQAGG